MSFCGGVLDVFIFCRFTNAAERERDSLIGNDKVFAMHLPSFTNSPKKEGGTLYAHSASLSLSPSVLYFRFNVTPRAFVFVSRDRNGERQCGMVWWLRRLRLRRHRKSRPFQANKVFCIESPFCQLKVGGHSFGSKRGEEMGFTAEGRGCNCFC